MPISQVKVEEAQPPTKSWEPGNLGSFAVEGRGASGGSRAKKENYLF